MPFTYILKCSDNTFYTGAAKDLEKRIQKHNVGKGAKYTRSRLPVKLMHKEYYTTMSDALKREKQIQKLKRHQKQKIILS